MNKWVKIVLGVIFGVGVLILIGFSNKHQLNQIMEAPEINLEIQEGVTLITEDEIRFKLSAEGLYQEEVKRSELDIRAIEDYLLNLNEIEEAEVFTKLGSQWFINVKARTPYARIIRKNRDGFYIDSRGKLMKLSATIKPRVLVFTGIEKLIPQNITYAELINNDSLITKYHLSDIYRISSYVCNSVFYTAQIVQVHYSEKEGFILIPRVGKHEIIFGMAASDEIVEKKFNKLTTFYEEVIPYEGWSKYKSINLKFDNQIVAKKN